MTDRIILRTITTIPGEGESQEIAAADLRVGDFLHVHGPSTWAYEVTAIEQRGNDLLIRSGRTHSLVTKPAFREWIKPEGPGRITAAGHYL